MVKGEGVRNQQSAVRIGAISDNTFTGWQFEFGVGHPAHAGLLAGVIAHDRGVVTGVDPQPGALHRGAEMIFAARDHRQALSLANRHDWQAPFFGEWAMAMLVEDALGVEVPARARWVRAVLAEHTRMASHLAYLTFVGHALARDDLATADVREHLRLRTAELTGNRVHPMAVRLGGVACEPTAAWAQAERATASTAADLAGRLRDALAAGLGRDVAAVSREQVDAHGLAGPVARASGVATDLRRRDDPHHEPWRACGDLLTTDASTAGDAHARLEHLAAEVQASATLVDRLLDALPEGPLVAHMPNVVKLPEGDWTSAVEAPLGRAGVFITSRGERTPWRLRLRTASFANVSAWASVLPGTALPDLPVAMASLPWVAGDLDK